MGDKNPKNLKKKKKAVDKVNTNPVVTTDSESIKKNK